MEVTEEGICELDDRIIRITQSEQQRKQTETTEPQRLCVQQAE